jgi:transposase
MAKRKQQLALNQITQAHLDSLPKLNLNAAGLDISASEIYVAVPADRAAQPVRAFGTYTTDLYALANWLAECGIDTVAMESTGLYWLPVYEILEGRGFEVYLVNARHLKNVAAKKTDVADCKWIQILHTFGLLQASFRPPQAICALRTLVRHRDNLVRYRSAHIQHMQKALQLMNVQLTQVISDITGVTGMQIIRAILAGERDPQVLARLRNTKCARTEAEIAKALQGHYQPEYVFMLKQAVAQYDFYQQQIEACDAELEAMYAALPETPVSSSDAPPPKPRGSQPRKNQAHFDLATALYRMVGVDLTAVDGLDALTVQDIISEIGLDMSKWPTEKHFTSWLCLAPNNRKSGGKLLSSRTKKTENRANRAFRLAAQSLSRSQSALGGFYRRMRAKHGAAKANVATAHKLARIVYRMLKDRKPYVDPGEAYYEQRYQERTIRNLTRKAAKLGLVLVPVTAQPSLVS